MLKKNRVSSFIPNHPEMYYSRKNRGWKGFGDFFGNGNIQNKEKTFINFKEARTIVRNIKFKNALEWKKWSSKNRPKNIPAAPDQIYKNKWIS